MARKKIVEGIIREGAEAAEGLIGKVTKPKTPNTPKTKTPKPSTKVTGSTTPTRTPKATPAITPTPKPTAVPKTPKVKATPRAEVKPTPRQKPTTKTGPKPSAKPSAKPTATPKAQPKKTKPTADLETPKAKPRKKPAAKPAAAPREIPGVTIGSQPSTYIDDALPEEFALGRATQQADDALAALAPDVPVAPVAQDIATEGVEAAAKGGLRSRLGGAVKNANLGAKPLVVGGALTAAPMFVPEESPEWLKNTANLGAVLGGALSLRGIRNSNFLGRALRGLTALGGAASVPALIGPGQQTAAAAPIEEIPLEETVAPGDVFPGEVPTIEGGTSPEEDYLAGLQDIIDSLQQQAEDDAAIGSAEVESRADAALQELIDLYGGMANVEAGVAANDPILAQELAAIEADYNAGMSQIANNYGAAISTVQGYQAEANAMYNQLASQQRAAFEGAAGGLELGGVPTGLIGSDASMSGISDTALGGAGITGAALTRSLGEAGQAGLAAEQMGANIDLGTALAQGRISQADLQAAIGRDRLSAISTSRQNAAQRASEERIRQQELAREAALTAASLKYERELTREERAIANAQTKADRKAAAAQYEAEAKMSLAQMVAGMSAEEYARWKGSSAGKSNYKTPTWFGKRLQGDPTKAVGGIKLSTLPANIGTVNDVLDMVDATLSSEAARNPITALATWQKFYESLDPDVKKVLQSRGIPTNAGAMYKELFKSTPSQ